MRGRIVAEYCSGVKAVLQIGYSTAAGKNCFAFASNLCFNCVNYFDNCRTMETLNDETVSSG
jgi:hypothetical protein